MEKQAHNDNCVEVNVLKTPHVFGFSFSFFKGHPISLSWVTIMNNLIFI